MRRIFWIFLILLMIIFQGTPFAKESQKITAAVAANFVRPMERLIDIFEHQTGIKVEATYSSTGKLYAQIKNGAPFDIFLAADTKRPELLFEQDLCLKPITYARGQAVLWVLKSSGLCVASEWQEVIRNPKVKKISIASPQTAPYGEAAKTALVKAGLWDQIKQRLVFAQAVSQSFQYAQLGTVDASFTALSYALSDKGRMGCYWTIPQAPLIVQDGCILKRTKNKTASRQFLEFITTKEAKEVLSRYGYR